MAFQDLLDQVGSLGRFQVLQTAFFGVCILIVYPHMLLENFTAAIPGHRCWVHILDNDTVSANGTEILSQDALLRISIPLDSNSKPEKCRRFLHPQWEFLHMNGTFPTMSEPDTEPCVDGWVYDRSSFPSTIATEWDLVCESQSLISVAQSLFMAAQLLGALIFGHLSDRFGRKMVFRWCLLKFAVVNTCATFAPTFLVYCSLRFLGGMCIITIVANCFIIMSEWTGPKSIALMAGIIINFCSVGQTLLGGLAFAIRDWRTLQLTMSIPFFVIFLFTRWLVESAQWLIVTHQLDEGLKELRRVADINGKKDAGEALTIEFVKSTMKEELDASQTKASLIHLFRTPKLRLRVCCLCFVRMATSLPFFGLLLNLQHLGSNIFLFQIIFGAVTFAIRCAVLLTTNHMGRRMSQMLSSFLVGISILVNTFLSQGTVMESFPIYGSRQEVVHKESSMYQPCALEPEPLDMSDNSLPWRLMLSRGQQSGFLARAGREAAVPPLSPLAATRRRCRASPRAARPPQNPTLGPQAAALTTQLPRLHTDAVQGPSGI
ncbi:PREDICTED: solute carrier family 22 member 24-like [Ceratotherium simum simum]|uniref:Solute carrier family 22 member 24-like n=1 Tax=Ceratotherium simum simum TaxID=73337 RepID=A0ABM1DA03_CERSS|nr:PREDICTED: solute carrier family 22 member 24-like [Ceratotherium simum simum]